LIGSPQLKNGISVCGQWKKQTEGENQKDRRGDLPMDKLIERGGFIEE
jgi:hypothetical protein